MSQAIQEAAAAIVALIHSSPRSPRQEEIEAILANAAYGGGTVPEVSDMDARWRQAHDDMNRACAVGSAEFTRIRDLEEITLDIWRAGARSTADLALFAKAALYWAFDVDGELGECPQDTWDEARADFEAALIPHAQALDRQAMAQLVNAALAVSGNSHVPVMSPAHAAHYQEWRGLIETHMLQFGAIDESGMSDAEAKADEKRMAEHMDIIDDLAARIFAEPAQTWGDVALYAQVAFWCHWSGVDPEGADAGPQLEAGPMSRGAAPDAALGKLLLAIFTVAGVGPFTERRR